MSLIAVVMAWHKPMNSYLQEWLRDNDVEWFRGSQDFGVDICRNQAIVRFLNQYHHDYLLMIDDDMYPLPETNEILEVEGDCFWCPYQTGPNERHLKNFGCSFSKYSRDLLKNLERPYFNLERELDLCRRTGKCECQFFEERLPVPARKIGGVGHLKQLVLLPDGDVKWP